MKKLLAAWLPIVFLSAVSAAPPPGATPRPAWKDKLYVGGGVGLAFGDVDYVELSPLIGYRFHPRVSAGLGASYRWKSDSRYGSSVSTTDWAGNLFARFDVVDPIFGQVEWEYLDYEYATIAGSRFRESESNVLAGVGFAQPLGGRGVFSAAALYNLSYDANDPTRAYDSPWVYRVGVTFGF